ncbi:MAG: ABC transporter substrate-binding protein [Sedimentisphaerales bacterium]|jgi:peptide/nickel transport system substrate-binding protein
MNGRSGLFTFFLVLLLGAVILLQVLSMIQSDRLYERLNVILDAVSGQRQTTMNKQESNLTAQSANKYPGDEGDWLIWDITGEPRTLNPVVVDADISTRNVVESTIIESLFIQDLDANSIKLKPKLAAKMDISDNGLEITITLKDNIHFSDGVPVTADDVVFSFQTIMNPKTDCASLRNYLQNITNAVKLDDRTIKFILKERYWKTIESVGELDIFPKHIYQFKNPEEFNKRVSNPVGSGPYVFEKWDVGQQVVLKRNENYWDKKPNLKKIVYKFIANAPAAVQALRSHDIDMFEPGSEQVTTLPKEPDFAKEFRAIIFWDPTFAYWYIGWNEQRPFFKDKKVRQTMTCLTDRKAMVEILTRGKGMVITGPFYIYGKANDSNIKPWPYDPQLAAKLLDEAGWIDHDGDGIRDKDGIPLRFKYSYPAGGASSEQIAKLLKDDAAKVGIDVIPNPVEWSIYLGNLHNRDFDAAESQWGGVVEEDPYQLFHSSQIQSGSDYVSFNNPQADKLIEEGRRELNEEKRDAIYYKFQKLLYDEQPYTFLFTRPRYYFVDRRFENVIVHKLGIDPFEWYVPKEKQRYK